MKQTLNTTPSDHVISNKHWYPLQRNRMSHSESSCILNKHIKRYHLSRLPENIVMILCCDSDW